MADRLSGRFGSIFSSRFSSPTKPTAPSIPQRAQTAPPSYVPPVPSAPKIPRPTPVRQPTPKKNVQVKEKKEEIGNANNVIKQVKEIKIKAKEVKAEVKPESKLV